MTGIQRFIRDSQRVSPENIELPDLTILHPHTDKANRIGEIDRNDKIDSILADRFP